MITFKAKCLKAFLISDSEASGRILNVLYGSETKLLEETQLLTLILPFPFTVFLFKFPKDETYPLIIPDALAINISQNQID